MKREKHAQVIIDEADRLTELVTDVLDLSKISSGVNEIKRETFDLSAFTAQVLEKFGYLAETQGMCSKRISNADYTPMRTA